jgi:mRNA deadenylase 3'-5' endonuclease subunit Ccr4
MFAVLGTWNIRSLYRSGSLSRELARELGKYKLYLVCIQEVGRRVALNGQMIVHSLWSRE